ncbi:FAD-dependent monooxygenase [Pseudonocardia sp. C8]|uniref:FAD-dependent monooxygenase n=1 Tax=Pseudonocardia sp. C8 TaxID=2762759 RepID=UPI001642D6BC|nr:FAD-dependent monooxygenase [Pseudonocardia sp. C8]MBC3193351.1 FAD-dependent monooxygenase [Pseudonocardia sp. C8]
MQLRRAAVLGGGPGGLYTARLLKLRHPSCEVVVYEQGPADATFGFGVGLAAGTQRKLEAADPDSLRDLVAAGYRHDMTMQVGRNTVRVHNDRLIGIARTELLAVLQRHAEKAGVALEFGERHDADDLDADLVVAADGIHSATRRQGAFGEHVEVGRGLYLWCAGEIAIPDAVFVPQPTEHGTFVTHAYPYSGGRSTFLIETDEQTWRRAGFDATTEATPPEASDEVALRYLEQVFAEQLQGRPLIGNRTRWLRFHTIRCDRWTDGRVALLGDAAHTAHFSIGSGTKLAMEDAIELVAALDEEPDLAAAFGRYEAVRRPAVERLQELARRSQLWWESFPSRTHLPVERLMVAYMSRAGNVPLDRFAETAPDVVAGAVEAYARESGHPPVGEAGGRVTDRVLAQPLRHGTVDACRRTAAAPPGLVGITDVVTDPWSDDGDAVVERARAARAAGAPGFRFTGPGDRPAVLTRLDLAERVRMEVGGLIVVDAPAGLRDDLAAGLVSGRTDLVELIEEQA